MIRHPSACVVLLLWAVPLRADAPVASYIFPAGGQRGRTVEVRVGGLNLTRSCGFEVLGPGVTAPPRLARTRTVWFEGPLLPLPDSQQAEDYPKDMAGRVHIAPDAAPGVRHWRLWTAQGATPAMKFLVGDLPEVVEEEIDGDPVPVAVHPPVTINGRIFPREDVDVWTFAATQGQTFTCEVCAARLGSPLDARLEVRDPGGRRLAEGDAPGTDPRLCFTAPADGTYQVRIHDTSFRGGQAYVYRLTITADPYVERTYPLGGRRGTRTAFELTGQGLPAGPVTIPLPAAGPADYAHRLDVAGKPTNPFLLDLDDLPEYREAEPNDEPGQVKPVAPPAVLNGRIGKPGDVDYWAVSARKGDVYDLDLRAARLGSPLKGVLTVLDPAGKELARADAVAAGQPDPSLRFTAPADGTFRVRVAERFRARGGPAFAYRLRVAPPAAKPDFRLRLAADTLSLNRGAEARLKVGVERLGDLADPIALTVDGLPSGVTAAAATIPAGQGSAEIPVKAEAAARIAASRLTVRGTARAGAAALTRTATLPGGWGEPDIDSVLLAVTLPTPFKVVGTYDVRWAARGTVHHRHYRLLRGGFTGPIEVSLADRQARHLQGVTGPPIVVPPGAAEFDYPVTLPPWMETGRTSRACVTAVGLVKDADGSEHAVSFSSLAQNEQIVAVIEPGRLGVEAEPASVTAVPGGTTSVAVRVSRARGLEGPVKLELLAPAHLRSIRADPVEVPSGVTTAALPIRFTEDARGPYNVPVVIRATLLSRGEPVAAEAKLEVLPPAR
jgi:hypothetical protein